MEVVGKIIQVLPLRQGTSKAGNPWKTQEYVLETEESYPRKICFDFFGDKADQYPLAAGDRVRLSFDIESREYQGRWFTSIRGWKADKLDPNQSAGAPQPASMGGGMPAPEPPAPSTDFSAKSDNPDDLPF